MKLLPLLLFFAAGPFWQDKPPEKWTDAELIALLTNSPWAQMVPPPAAADAPALRVFLSTAGPMEVAERERDRRYKIKHPRTASSPGAQPGAETGSAPGDALAEEYRAWLAENRAKQIVLTIAVRDSPAFADEQEIRRMEDESVMQIGRKKFKMTGHFPPTASDPYLHLAFPRAATAADKAVIFDFYIPGVPIGSRSAEFRIKDMLTDGKLEM